MKISLLVQVFILISFCCSIIFGSEDQNNKVELKDLLPQAGKVKDWVPDGKAKYAAGKIFFC
jgi:hypothetical protein